MTLTRWQRARIRANFIALAVGDWILRWIYAQHNARVIVDFENRMVSVIYAASRGMMSKPYYTAEAMLAEIEQARSAEYDDAYAEGRKDALEELGDGVHGIEIVIFETAHHARASGFEGRVHPVDDRIRAWWPDLGPADLMCRPLRRVTTTAGTSRLSTSEGRVADILRCRQQTFGDRAIWVEL